MVATFVGTFFARWVLSGRPWLALSLAIPEAVAGGLIGAAVGRNRHRRYVYGAVFPNGFFRGAAMLSLCVLMGVPIVLARPRGPDSHEVAQASFEDKKSKAIAS